MSDFFRFAQLSIVLRSKKHAYRLQFIFMIIFFYLFHWERLARRSYLACH